jgi:hypothetical protein
MGSGATPDRTTEGGGIAVAPHDPFRAWRALQDPVGIPPGRQGDTAAPHDDAPRTTGLPPAPDVELAALTDLDDPRLVLSESFVGVDRRRPGLRAALTRVTFGSRRKLLRLDVLLVVAVVAVVVGSAVLVTTRPRPTTPGTEAALALPSNALSGLGVAPTTPAATAPAAAPATTVPPAPAPAATPVPATATPATTAPAPIATTSAAPAAPPTTPDAMGAAALALVRYPWQQLSGYSIRFLPIADAPSPGFYGNTDFTWGQEGGVSTLYVYPGETVQQLAGITAFEIGHEVDAAFVEPRGGHAQISAVLGVDPPSWAPECDCAEQGYLSGWYAAAFSDYWSPGVGAWSSLAPPPSGAVLTAVEPWLDPSIS